MRSTRTIPALLAFALCSTCLPAEQARISRAVTAAACDLVPVLADDPGGRLVGAFCADVARAVSEELANPLLVGKRGMLVAPCPRVVPVRGKAGAIVGYACPAAAPFCAEVAAR